MNRPLAVLLVIAAASVSAMAGGLPVVPEINPASAVAALTLLGGGLLVLRSKLKK